MEIFSDWVEIMLEGFILLPVASCQLPVASCQLPVWPAHSSSLIPEFMPGETNLAKLLQNMAPELNPGEYVFYTSPVVEPEVLKSAIGMFREKEGYTYILPREIGPQFELSGEAGMAWITLQVPSSLQAVGLTAAVSSVLAEAGISCNVVAAYYHDHLFVPTVDAGRAVELLKKLSKDQYKQA